MSLSKIAFKNDKGEKLAARLELPANQTPHNFVLFAHCFTCNKNLSAVRNIGRALTSNGFGVLRFDFTGLGESEGDFADTNFSSNIQDLFAAAKFLEENYAAPSVLIGHSLGGAAAIFAGAQIDSVQAIATIGAPADPVHVQHLFQHGLEEIEQTGKATIEIGGRAFTIQKQFLEDLETKNLAALVKEMRKALLVMHSPQDRTVAIENAREIYHAAHHPKSFISLDGADHLLGDKKDSLYVGEIIASWVKRYVEIPSKTPLSTNMQVVAQLGDDKYTTQIQAGKHHIVADEPESVGGNDFGLSPYELVSAGLGACTAMTLRMYANRKKWDLQEITVHLEHSKQHALDCETCETQSSSRLDHFDRVIEVKGDLSREQKERLLEIADKCPVHRTLHGDVVVRSRLEG